MVILYRCTGRATIFLEGAIDLATVSAVRAALSVCRACKVAGVDVEMSAVRFRDAGGLHALLAASQHFAESEADALPHRPPPVVRRLLALTGTGFLPTADTPSRAHEDFRQASDAA
ncbi:STAS domain-containing protein [Streptomyces fructofermentans]